MQIKECACKSMKECMRIHEECMRLHEKGMQVHEKWMQIHPEFSKKQKLALVAHNASADRDRRWTAKFRQDLLNAIETDTLL